MNHELGHGYGFPHWSPKHSDDGVYPYLGQRPKEGEELAGRGGGYGHTWGIDQQLEVFVNPLCPDGLERQSPMQRNGTCLDADVELDHYSDYEAQRIVDNRFGRAEQVNGTVSYLGADVAYSLPKRGGRISLEWLEPVGAVLWQPNPEDGSMTELDPTADDYPHDRPSAIEVPVRMFFGAYALGDPDHQSYFDEPVDYFGNLLLAVDPSNEDGFAVVSEHESTWYKKPHDLSVRLELADGSVVYRLVAQEHALREDGQHDRFGVNVPLEMAEQVTRAELVRRPFGHNDPDTQLGDATPATFYEAAEVLATWEP